MKAISAALVLLAVLAMAEARPTMRVLNKHSPSTAKASATAKAEDGGTAYAGSVADTYNGGSSVADADAYAKGEDAYSGADATAYAADWGYAYADSDSYAAGDGAKAYSDSKAVAVGEVAAYSDAGAYAYGDKSDASAYSVAKGDSKATAKATAYTDDYEDPEKKYYGYDYYGYGYYGGYYDPDDSSDDKDDDKDDYGYGYGYGYYYDPHKYYYGYEHPQVYYGYKKAVDPEDHYDYYAYYKPVLVSTDDKKEDKEEEHGYTKVAYVDPAILAYYAQKVYDYGCYEGKYYRCTYDESCGECPYGYFCGEKTEDNVCEDVTVWVKKCDAKPTKHCAPALTACGKGFCKYNQKCATDYYWCGAKWCTPKYTCVDVEDPKDCVWEVVEGKKVQKCAAYAPEACVAGEAPCAIGHKCTEDPCTFVEETVKKCGPKSVPVCVAYDIPIYKTLYKQCGPGVCHPGYKCEGFEHDSCVVKVVHHPIYYGVKPVDPHYYVYEESSDDKDDESSDDKDDYGYYGYKPYKDDKDDKDGYKPHYGYKPDKDDEKSSASVKATSYASSGYGDPVTYTNVDAKATGDGKAYGAAGAYAGDKDSAAGSYSDAAASKDYTGATAVGVAKGDAKAGADASGTYDSDK